MKNFLKKNLALIILLILSILFLILGSFLAIFLSLACLCLGFFFFILAYKAKQKYNALKDITEEDVFIDATKYDYDEDIYYIGGDKKQKTIGKNTFAKLNALSPTILLSIIGVAFVSMGLFFLTNILF